MSNFRFLAIFDFGFAIEMMSVACPPVIEDPGNSLNKTNAGEVQDKLTAETAKSSVRTFLHYTLISYINLLLTLFLHLNLLITTWKNVVGEQVLIRGQEGFMLLL